MPEIINFLNGHTYTMPSPDERGHYTFEYLDRQHNNTICAAVFVKITTDMLTDDLIGKRFISPLHGCDSKYQLPVIYTVLKITGVDFLCYSERGGAISREHCFLELE